MKNIKHHIAIILLTIGCVLLIVQCFKQRATLVQKENKDARVTKAIITEAKEIKRKVDEKGIETVLFDITGNKATVAQVQSNEATKGIIDTTAMALDIRTKQLKEILVVKGVLEAENLKLRRQVDANNRPYYTYKGNGLDLKFSPPYNELDTNDQGTADFRANVKIKATQYWKRNWFLGSKKSILAVTSDMPEFFKINGADYVEFEQKQPALGLRLQANGSYNIATGEITYGPALRVDLGRLSIQGRYSRFPSNSKWVPSINASYDLLRF
jgi:hypothetical protein